MCGFVGIFTENSFSEEVTPTLRSMTDSLIHRGPDDAGYWRDPDQGIALGHRRLSILDLSPAGHQPMASRTGRYKIALNGEIYNFQALRQKLSSFNISWRGHSDTEVLLEYISEFGVEKTLQDSVGMFAFALWDQETNSLTLARDRFGEKPLYYGFAGKYFLFGSELKALRAHPAWTGEIDRDALALFLKFNCIPTPYSIFKGFKKLSPATFLKISKKYFIASEPTVYWNRNSLLQSRKENRSDEEAINDLQSLLSQTVRDQMVSDVPVGAFLSGGIDSSLIVALMQNQSAKKVKTFTIGYSEASFDESKNARAVSEILGTDHTELILNSNDCLSLIPSLSEIYDEPFADSSQLPTLMVSRLTRHSVTVSLSGDGADEIFGGYNRYTWGQKLWSRFQYIPTPLRASAGHALNAFSPPQWEKFFKLIKPLIDIRLPGLKMQKLAEALKSSSSFDFFLSQATHWRDASEVVIGASSSLHSTFDSLRPLVEKLSFTEQMMFIDLFTYLTDDILVKVDRAAMSTSLETRVPFLDHRIVEFAWNLPLHYKIRNGKGKWILRELLSRSLPSSLFDRPKMGFGVPMSEWLRGPLKAWASDLLNPASLQQSGFFEVKPISQKWKEHLEGKRDWGYHLWDILIFEEWRRSLSKMEKVKAA